jgi:putative ABC transport system permease protein
MFKNYIKIGFRTLWRDKAYSLINIIGLAIGITGATLLLTYVKDETSYDKFHAKSDDIVRAVLVQHNDDGDRIYGVNQPILAKTLVSEIPEVLEATSLQIRGGHINFVIDGVRYSERNYFIGDSSFFNVFDYKLKQGDRSTVLNEPNSIVLSEMMANRLFGKTDAIGSVLTIPFFGEHKVTGIVENAPTNSHLQFDVIISGFTGNENWDNNQLSWQNFNGSSYMVLAPNTNLEQLAEKVNKLADERMGAGLAEVIDFKFQALHDIHFDSENIERGFESGQGDRSYILIFSSIAIFLLLIAAVNYMNLATSKAVFRAKEIGIRKVVGAVKGQLVGQFLTESIIITLIALIISIGLTDLTMPFFNQLTGKQFDFSWVTLMDYLPMFLIIAVSVGLLSGVYPSFFMTRFKPVEVLKGEKVSGGSFSLRKALVVFQFVMSIVLIITTLIVQNQMSFIKERDLGFNDENLMVIDINNGNVRRDFKAMRSEFESIPGVQSVGVSSRVPGEWKGINEIGVELLGDAGEARDSARVYFMGFDPGMFETFDFRLIDGGFFSGNDQSDSLKIMVNEAAVKAFGLTNPLGTTINMGTRNGKMPVQVIGILEDFNFKSLHTQIEPIIIGAWNNPGASIDYFTLKMAGNTAEIIEQATLVHNKFDQQTAMEYHFLENQLEIFYEKETEASAIFKVGAGLSIFVACLGLFGLASFTVQKRVKEMGIRKVLGASQWNLFYLLSSSFTKQVIVAFVIASPIAYFIMRNWLQKFVYSVNIGVGVFIIAGVAAILVALTTVSYRSLRAANSNPVGSLRQE